MNYQEFLSKCWENHRLLSLMLELTFACQYKCPFCYNEKNIREKILNLKKYEEILKDAKSEGCLYLTLSGGEPTLSKDFFKICKIANGLNYSIRIKSNGYNWEKDFVKRLKDEVSPFNVDLSLLGGTEKTYEKVSGVLGSFRKFLKTIEYLKKEGIRIRFKFPLNSLNEKEVDGVFKFARELEIKIDGFAEITPMNNGDLFPLNFSPSKEAIIKMYENIYKLNNRETLFFSEEEMDKMELDSPFACGAGIANLCIDPYGNVFPCVAWRHKVGNLWEKGLKDIWNSKEINKIISINKRANKRKKINPSLKGEIFCPGMAEIQYKNPLTIYPEAVKISKLRKFSLNLEEERR